MVFAASEPLVMGVTPFMSPVALFERFSPLRDYLTDKLGREVVLETAKNYQRFLQKIREHEYDLVFATPVIAFRALDDAHYHVGAISEKKTQPLLMVAAQSLMEYPVQLSAKKVALPPTASVINLIAGKWFISKGVEPDELPEFVNYNSHNAAYQAALSGDVDAAFVASFAVKQLRKKLPILRVIGSAGYLPGSSILYTNSLDGNLQRRLTSLMVELKQSQQGREILNRISFPPFRRPGSSEYEVMRAYVPVM
ncbi:MAG TPA: phosphate/phosphite/phosphonate ABC transporter substrate-binding protein [Ectothiorhodospiraceae bacterium]|nr:phosphate/phosphite/phosphonate ABC transporter substrate-binding protein [Ectothiorhodospiraceae bacterium]